MNQWTIDVNEENFEAAVLGALERSPVLVDFWAEWCGPCKTLGPVLEKLADEYAGDFVLAKLNVDENPNLAGVFDIQGIPAVKLFSDGDLASEFTGALPGADAARVSRPSFCRQPAISRRSKRPWPLKPRENCRSESPYQAISSSDPNHAKALLGWLGWP